jgi:glycosyltransferase involved in cell wall biosynthesis
VTAPRVSIGLPVFNGEKFLRECLDSLLAQTFADFEIIICDNASSDGTEEICRAYAARDRRIRYHRNPENLGAGRNYNLTFELARGELFKWASHDDVCAPRFLQACVEELDRNAEAVLAFPKMVDVDEGGRSLGVRNISHIPRWERGAYDRAHRRFRNLLRTDYTVEEIFGVIRSEVLRKSELIRNYTDSDRTLLVQLGLHGKCVEVPELLFYHRLHAGMSTRAYVQWQERASWFDPTKAGRPVYPLWTQFFRYLRVVAVAPVTLAEKGICYFWMVNWLRRRRDELAAEIRYALKARRVTKSSGRTQ